MKKSLQKMRTERAIQTAFIHLVNEQGFNGITISNIADEALINRQTFYYYYQDKYQLAKNMITSLVEEYDQLYKDYVTTNVEQIALPKRIPLLFPQTNSFWLRNREKIAALFSIELDDYSLEKELKQRFQDYLPILLGRSPLALENKIFPAIILAVIAYVVETATVPTEAEIIETFTSISETFN